ncbi:Transcriptional regulator, IclR family [Alloactinosynnema sp. L-07]|uniref:IclR family transcriptional regulator n=1 Tax=Alloactinosynnema sp. L-07 TaxID=1653480 RepID=UPI00065F0925|nr:IclR family transcriptional regulator [Alloactinosynnema sp. L-07]CRK56580.1 Transcriptional regulator, IclR family [Alloactinosynnema sp. L-07]
MTASAERLSSVAAAARILREFGKHSTQLGVSQLARRVGVGKSTAHRIIWTLVEEGLLEKVEETGLFRLTSAMRSLGASAETAQRLHEAATMPLDHLRTLTTGTLHIAILDGPDVLYIERREGPGTIPVFRSVGARNAAHATSSGKVLLAYLPAEQRDRLIEGMRLTPKTPRTLTSRAALIAELTTVRQQGFAENRGESQAGMCSIAAPVRDPLGRVVASVSVAQFVEDVDAGLRHLARHVVETAARISAGLGWSQ